jgi:hypothetical protein
MNDNDYQHLLKISHDKQRLQIQEVISSFLFSLSMIFMMI